MGPYLKSIFRKSLNSEPTLVFLFSFIEIGRNKGQQFFYRNRKHLILLLVNRVI